MSAFTPPDDPFTALRDTDPFRRPARSPAANDPVSRGPEGPAPGGNQGGGIIPEDPFIRLADDRRPGPFGAAPEAAGGPPPLPAFGPAGAARPAYAAPPSSGGGYGGGGYGGDPIFGRGSQSSFGGGGDNGFSLGAGNRHPAGGGFGAPGGYGDDFFGVGRAQGQDPASLSLLAPQADSPVERAFDAAALNPLVGAASPLLWLAARLNESMPPDDVRVFRNAVLDEVRRFSSVATARGLSPVAVRVARYALCATVDDIVLNTPWGGQSDWPTQGLVSTLYQETWGGERFFDLLSQLHANPEENIDALELMAICLAIGFVGRFRVVEGGAGHLMRLRSELYRTIRRVRGPYERELSPGWTAIAAPYRPPARTLWLWGLGGGVLALLALVYVGLGLLLSNRVDSAVESVAALTPAVPVLIERPVIPPIPEIAAAPIVAVPDLTQLERISAALGPDIADNQVAVAAEDGDVAVRLLAASFPSAGATLSENEAPLVSRIAEALEGEPGPITVIGHTDNIPLGGGDPNRTNTTLSAERAASAASMLSRYLSDPGRVASEGRGESDPIAGNDTAEGRALNRRVEFRIPAEDAPL